MKEFPIGKLRAGPRAYHTIPTSPARVSNALPAPARFKETDTTSWRDPAPAETNVGNPLAAGLSPKRDLDGSHGAMPPPAHEGLARALSFLRLPARRSHGPARNRLRSAFFENRQAGRHPAHPSRSLTQATESHGSGGHPAPPDSRLPPGPLLPTVTLHCTRWPVASPHSALRQNNSLDHDRRWRAALGFLVASFCARGATR